MGNSDSTKNGQQLGAENVAALDRYLESLRQAGSGIPAKNGKVSYAAVALASGVSLQNLYKNPQCRERIELAAQDIGLVGIEARNIGAPKDDGKDYRIQCLEAKVAALTGEVYGLRRQLAQYGHLEAHIVATGRRVIP